MSPTAVQDAAAIVPAQFTITLGTEGLRPGGYAQLYWYRWSEGRFHPLKEAVVSSSRAGATFSIDTGRVDRQTNFAKVTLTSAVELVAGDTITVTGNLAYGSFVSSVALLRARVFPTGAGTEYTLQNEFTLRSKNLAARKLLLTSQATPTPGLPTRLLLAVTDQFGNPVVNFTGTVSFSATVGAVQQLPASYTFTPADQGTKEFQVIYPVADKVVRLRATHQTLTGFSNPVLPTNAPTRIFFGDSHNHSELSADGWGNPGAAYSYGRNIAGLDIAVLSEHQPTDPALWKTIQAATDSKNQKDRFVTLQGYEWSSDVMGHRNVYYLNAGPPMPGHLSGIDNTQPLWDYLDSPASGVTTALTIPHHTDTTCGSPTCWQEADLSKINHKYQRLIEIYQGRGSFEMAGPNAELKIYTPGYGASAQDALAMGHRMGFIGSSDLHAGMIGHGPGYFAVHAPALSRGGVYNAMYARRTYAITRDRMLVFFTLNNAPMGSEIRVSGSAPRNVSARVIGATTIKRIDLLRNNVVEKSWDGGGKDDLTVTYSSAALMTGREWWYLRVIQTNGELAWASPVWVDPA